jgi:hypothetical protein
MSLFLLDFCSNIVLHLYVDSLMEFVSSGLPLLVFLFHDENSHELNYDINFRFCLLLQRLSLRERSNKWKENLLKKYLFFVLSFLIIIFNFTLKEKLLMVASQAESFQKKYRMGAD